MLIEARFRVGLAHMHFPIAFGFSEFHVGAPKLPILPILEGRNVLLNILLNITDFPEVTGAR